MFWTWGRAHQMEQEEANGTEPLEWHLIARDGDMTARVHRDMTLGESAAGELSFEPEDGLLGVTVEDEQLKLAVLREDLELLVPGRMPARAVLVSPHTRVVLSFREHTLDIDNDFARPRPLRDTLYVHMAEPGREDEVPFRGPLGPASAGHRATEPGPTGEIIVHEPWSAGRLTTSPDDHLSRDAVRQQRRSALPAVPRAPLLLGAGVLVTVAVLLVVALYLPGRLDAPEVEPPVETTQAVTPAEPPADPSGTTGAASPPMRDAAPDPQRLIDGPAAAQPGVVSDTLARLDALLASERLPDKTIIDFMVASLKSLQAAYPDDVRLSLALETLTLRLAGEARVRYDDGEAFLAGRLIELASTTGAAEGVVAETERYFSSNPPGSRRAVEAPAAASAARPEAPSAATAEAASVAASPAESTADAGAEPAGAPAVPEDSADLPAAPAASTVAAAEGEAAAQVASPAEPAGDVAVGEPVAASTEPASVPPEPAIVPPAAAIVPPEEEGLDVFIDQATGVALGALAVEEVLEDPLSSEAPGLISAAGPSEALPGAGGPAVSANALPPGFAGEEVATPTAPWNTPELQPADAVPPFYPLSELTVTSRVPLEYPSRALDGTGGTVDLTFTVTETGRVIDVVGEGDLHPIFIQAASRTIARWRFEPVVVDGEAVPVRSAIRVRFQG